MGRRMGSKNKYLLSEYSPVHKTTQTKSKFWVPVSDFIMYYFTHPGHKQIYFNKNYGVTHAGEKIGIVKVTEDVFTDIQNRKKEDHEAAVKRMKESKQAWQKDPQHPNGWILKDKD